MIWRLYCSICRSSRDITRRARCAAAARSVAVADPEVGAEIPVAEIGEDRDDGALVERARELQRRPQGRARRLADDEPLDRPEPMDHVVRLVGADRNFRVELLL